ncbi:DUF418 domain-containing protein [Nonomuraea sp. NPDC049421]|uniref:DUF418 domain-containing protein n=1 Tax=Nonomuraea sp. NPDC049421 TaxID=3155275 RepID=UPI0034429BE2
MTMSTQVPAVPAGTVPRALAPDLARGAMLLAIAFAHAPLFIDGTSKSPPLAGVITDVFHFLFVNNHARPLFAFLFGYSLVQLLDRRLARGADWLGARKLLRRRGWWLVVFGLAHTALLVPIDILAGYGVAALILVPLLRRSDKALLWTAGLTLVPGTLLIGAAMWLPMSQGQRTYEVSGVAVEPGVSYAAGIVERVSVWPLALLIELLMVVPGVVLGMWAARRRFLDEPERHRPFLVRAAVLTTVVSIAGSLPAALMHAGVWADPSGAALWAAVLAQPLTGYAGGIGMAAIVALIAIRAAERRGRFTTMVESLGQRSMSMYLFQSVAFVLLFAPYALGLQDDLGRTGATLAGAATWALSLLLADVMRRAGHRGPAELLLRRLAYR